MSAFGKAFSAARKAGKKEFSFNGKKYNTKMAFDTPKSAPPPTAKPDRSGRAKTSPPKQTAAGGRATKAPKAAKVAAKSGAQPSRAAANAIERRYKNDDLRTFRKKKK